MRCSSLSSSAVSACLVASLVWMNGWLAAAEPARAAGAKWESLFDGKTLGGWKPSEFGGTDDIEVEDGRLING